VITNAYEELAQSNNAQALIVLLSFKAVFSIKTSLGQDIHVFSNNSFLTNNYTFIAITKTALMKIMKYLIPLALLLFSCNTSFDYNAMAVEMCECLEPMSKVSEEIEEASKGTDTLLMRQLIQKIEIVAEQSDSCASRLSKKYGDISPENEEKAQKALNNCSVIFEN